MQPDYHCLIVGAGFSGIGAAIKLDKAGFGDYLIIEAGDGVGGTWYWNTYPGIAVDIPSFSYQFSFEQSRDWSRTYAPGGELKAYAEHCVDKYGICAARSGSTPRCRPPSSTTSGPVAASRLDPGGEVTRAIPDQRQRRADRAQAARHRRRRLLRRHHHAHRALGPQPGPDRQAGRGHRHRRLGGAGDPRDRANCRAAHRLSAHADLVLPEVRRAAARAGALGDAAFPAARPCSGCSARPTSS